MVEAANIEAPGFPHLTDSGRAILKDAAAKRVTRVLYDVEMPSGLRGFLVKIADQWTMLINPADGQDEQCFTVAHELGHLFLGHQPSQMNPGWSIGVEEGDKAQEGEADAYAHRLLSLLSLQEEAFAGMDRGAIALI
jgi:Zn-dependent peptidase ImmA (M78 family)